MKKGHQESISEEILQRARRAILEKRPDSLTASWIQRQLPVPSYNKASRILEKLREERFIGESDFRRITTLALALPARSQEHAAVRAVVERIPASVDVTLVVHPNHLDSASRIKRPVQVLAVPCADLWIRDWAPVRLGGRNIKFKYAPGSMALDAEMDDDAGHLLASELLPGVRETALPADGGCFVSSGTMSFVSQRVVPLAAERRDARVRFLKRVGFDGDGDGDGNITFLPPPPGDPTGHLDGVLAFLDESTVAVASYEARGGVPRLEAEYQRNMIDYTEWLSEEIASRIGLKVLRLPCDFPKSQRTSSPDDLGSAAGCRVNLITSGDICIMPGGLSRERDAQAVRILESAGFKVTVIPEKVIAPITKRGGSLHCISWNY